MADIKGLERDILQIKERANNMIAYDRQKEYNELQELKEILGNSEVGARNKLHMFQFMLEMNNERLKTV